MRGIQGSTQASISSCAFFALSGGAKSCGCCADDFEDVIMSDFARTKKHVHFSSRKHVRSNALHVFRRLQGDKRAKQPYRGMIIVNAAVRRNFLHLDDNELALAFPSFNELSSDFRKVPVPLYIKAEKFYEGDERLSI